MAKPLAAELAAKKPANTPRPVATKPDRAAPLQQPRATIMGGLTLLALGDYAATRTGVLNDAPGGNPSYAVAAAVLTVALWGVLPGYSPAHRAASRGARSLMYLVLLAIHGIAGGMAYVPRRNPTAMVVVDSTGTTLALVAMVLVAVYAWWCRVCPLVEDA